MVEDITTRAVIFGTAAHYGQEDRITMAAILADNGHNVKIVKEGRWKDEIYLIVECEELK